MRKEAFLTVFHLRRLLHRECKTEREHITYTSLKPHAVFKITSVICVHKNSFDLIARIMCVGGAVARVR